MGKKALYKDEKNKRVEKNSDKRNNNRSLLHEEVCCESKKKIICIKILYVQQEKNLYYSY